MAAIRTRMFCWRGKLWGMLLLIFNFSSSATRRVNTGRSVLLTSLTPQPAFFSCQPGRWGIRKNDVSLFAEKRKKLVGRSGRNALNGNASKYSRDSTAGTQGRNRNINPQHADLTRQDRDAEDRGDSKTIEREIERGDRRFDEIKTMPVDKTAEMNGTTIVFAYLMHPPPEDEVGHA